IRDFHVTGVQTCALPIYRTSVGRGCGDGACVWANSRPGRRRRREVRGAVGGGRWRRRRRREVEAPSSAGGTPSSATEHPPGRPSDRKSVVEGQTVGVG